MTHWLLTQISPGVFLGRDRDVSGSMNLTSIFGRMNPTEFLLAVPPWSSLGAACVSVMQLCSVNPYAYQTGVNPGILIWGKNRYAI